MEECRFRSQSTGRNGLRFGWAEDGDRKSSQIFLGSSSGSSEEQMALEGSLRNYVFAPRQTTLRAGRTAQGKEAG